MTILLQHLRYVKSADEISSMIALRDYGLDSKEAVDLLMDLEDEFGVAFPDELLTDETFKTAQSLWRALGIAKGGVSA
ncbi:MAG: phosphopantetheine-binding protein [Propionibacteriaceae bacterium]|nr:phosphopantetheine-binding protein [Propionibacteriaceae bacterium]